MTTHAELLERARIDREELRLTRPAGENAYERYRQVLELDPADEKSRETLATALTRSGESAAAGAYSLTAIRLFSRESSVASRNPSPASDTTPAAAASPAAFTAPSRVR